MLTCHGPLLSATGLLSATSIECGKDPCSSNDDCGPLCALANVCGRLSPPRPAWLTEELILRACRADPNAGAKLREYDESAGPRKRRKTAAPVEPEQAEQAAEAAEATVAQRQAVG